jgi:hypothetical protein
VEKYIIVEDYMIKEKSRLITFILSTCVITVGILTGCSNEKSVNTIIQPTPTVKASTPQSSGNSGTSTSTSSSTQTSAPSNSSSYTKEQLEKDKRAPSKNPADYNSNGEFVPRNGISSNPADYNAKGEYKPVDQMTKEEKRKELEDMLGKSLR